MMSDPEFEAYLKSDRAQQPASIGFVVRLVRDLQNLLKGGMQKRIERFAAIERRLDELEAAPFEYTGVHEEGKAYRRGQFVTFQGSVWACKSTTLQRPGDSDAWQLAVKKGKDGKDWDAR